MKVRKVHNYFVGERIAEGSISNIYIAFRASDQYPVALRLISKRRFTRIENGSALLFNERILVPLLQHDHIVHIFEVIESAAQIFQIMDYFPHGDLETFIMNSQVSTDIILRILDEILSAVEYLHMHHLCHRDLKLENVLVTHDNHVKLTDFGFCSFSNGRDISLACGTMGYAAPEVFIRQPFDGIKADIWSIGVIIYSLFAKKLPFPDAKRISPANIDFKGIPHDISDLISRILRPNPSNRPTVSEIRRHPVFNAIEDRAPTIPLLDLTVPTDSICSDILIRLAECLDRSIDELKNELESEGANMAKVLYDMLSCNVTAESVKRGSVEESQSLPDHRFLSARFPAVDDSVHVSTVRGSRNEIVRALVNFMLQHKFCVSGSVGCAKTLVLNQSTDDIKLELRVDDSSNGWEISVRGDVEKTMDIIDGLNRHLEHTFGL
jgi:serine/threonine protein kinase